MLFTCATAVPVADYFPNYGFECYSTFVHTYHSLCVRAHLVEVGPDACREPRKAKNSACIGNDILLENEVFTEVSEASLLDQLLDDDECGEP